MCNINLAHGHVRNVKRGVDLFFHKAYVKYLITVCLCVAYVCK